MAGSGKTYSDFQWTNASLKKAASTLKSTMSQVKIPISTTVTKKSVAETKKQIKGYFANTYVPINIIVSKSSLSAAKKQLQTALSAVSLPQITVNPRTARALRSISNTIGNLSNATNNAVATAGSRRGGGGGGGGSGGGKRNSAGGTGGFGSGLALGRLSGEASEFSKSMDAATARVFAFGATAVVLNSVTQSFQALITATIDVEKRLTEIQAIAGTSDEEFGKFRDTIFSVASNTGQTFSTVADGAAELARQGLSATEITERLNASLILTRVSGLAAEDSVASLTAVINGFTSANLEANEIVNKVIAVDTSFAVSAKDLADGFTRAGSTAEDAGLSFDELLGLITALQQRTQRGGAVIGNALKTIFTRISSSSTIEDLKALGVEIDASQSGVEKLKALSDAFQKFGNDPVKGNQIKEIAGGKYQINIVSAALKDLSDQQSLFAKATQVSNDATNEAFVRNAELNKTLSAQFNDLAANATNLSEKIGQITFAPFLGSLVSNVSDLSKTLSSQLNEDVGNNLAKSLFSGIGTFISGPGTVLVLSLFLRVFGLVSQFAKQGVQELNILNASAYKQAEIQKRVSLVLQEQSSLYQRISAQSVAQGSAASRIQILLKNELKASEQRLLIEKNITKELQKRGAYMTAGGQIGFDATKGARIKRVVGEAVQSPAASLAASLALGAGSSFINSKNEESSTSKINNLSSKIERLKESISKLNEETDKNEINKLNVQISKLNEEIARTEKETSESARKVNFAFGALATSILLASTQSKLGKGSGAILAGAAIGASVGDEFIAPYVESWIARQLEGVDVDLGKIARSRGDIGQGLSTRDDSSVFSFAQEAESLTRESNKLKRALEELSNNVLITAESFKSELKVRSESQSIFDKNLFGGTSSNLKLNKSLNDLLTGSSNKDNKNLGAELNRELRVSQSSFEIAELIESLAKTAQKTSNARVKELGFGSTSKVDVGSNELIEASKLLSDQLKQQKIGNEPLFNKLSGSTQLTNLNSDANARSFAEGVLRDLGGLKNLNPTVKGAAEDIVRKSSARQEVGILSDASEGLRKILSTSTFLQGTDSNTSQSATRIVLDELKKLRENGLVPEEDLQNFTTSFFEITENFAENQRELILESAKNELENIQAQRKLNDDFINKLKAVYEESVTSVRNLRGEDLGAGIEKTALKDVFSQGLSDALDSLGIQGFDKSGVISSSGNLQQFAQGILGQTARKTDSTGQVVGGLAQPLNLLSQGGYSTRLTKDRQTLLQEQLKNIDISNEVGQLSPFARKTFGNTVLESQKSLKGGNFENAISLQELAKINLGQNQGKYTKSDEDLIKRIALSLGQQFKITDEFVRTQLPQNLQGASQNVDQSLNETEVSAIESRMASLEGLTKFETEVATLYETVLSPQLKSYAEILPSAVTATKLLADRITERANALGSGPSLDALADGANRASTALLEIEKTIKENSQKTGDAIRDIGPEIKSKLDTSFEAITESLRLAKEKIDRFNANNPTPIGAPQ